MKTLKLVCQLVLVLSIIAPKISQAQSLKACDLTTVEAINTAVNTHLVFDANSIVNKNGKFECRYTDLNSASTYIAIGLLQAKVEYGYDLLVTDFKSNQTAISSGKKAGGKFTVFKAVDSAGKNAFYMTGEKDDFSPEAFQFKFRKGDYIVTVSSNNIPLSKLTTKLSEIYVMFGKM